MSEEKSYVLRTLQVPSLFVSLELNRALTRVYVLEDHSYPGDGDRRVWEGLLATSLGLIGGFWTEKGEHLWRGSAKLSVWQPHWWDQLFWVQRTVITSSPSGGVYFFFLPSTYSPSLPLFSLFPSLVHWLRVLSSFQTHLNLASGDVCVSPGDFLIHQ